MQKVTLKNKKKSYILIECEALWAGTDWLFQGSQALPSSEYTQQLTLETLN